MVTQEDVNNMKSINNMVTTISIATHKTTPQIEDKPLSWYLVNTVIDPYTVELLQYKDIMKSK